MSQFRTNLRKAIAQALPVPSLLASWTVLAAAFCPIEVTGFTQAALSGNRARQQRLDVQERFACTVAYEFRSGAISCFCRPKREKEVRDHLEGLRGGLDGRVWSAGGPGGVGLGPVSEALPARLAQKMVHRAPKISLDGQVRGHFVTISGCYWTPDSALKFDKAFEKLPGHGAERGP